MTGSVRAVVLGLGNRLLSDEGAGVQALHRLGPLPEGIEALEGGTDGLRMVAHLRGVRRLLVLDAVDSGREAGTVVRMEGEDLAGLPGGAGVHRLGLADLLATLEFLGDGPEEVVLLGVQPASLEAGLDLSTEVEASLVLLVEHARAQVEAWAMTSVSPGAPSSGHHARVTGGSHG